MYEACGIGPGHVIINRAILIAGVILTGLIKEALEGLEEMVIIAMSSDGTIGTRVFSNKISLLSIRRWMQIGRAHV